MNFDVEEDIRKKWDALVDSVAELFDIPAALIMHVGETRIEVFSSSNSEGNPYKVGDSEVFENSGLYCEWVIKNQEKLLVPNAKMDPNWDQNPDIKLDMISYLGFPVNYPDGKPFGTFCILDNKENAYSVKVENFLRNLKGTIEDHLILLYQRNRLIKTLHGVVPICASCKKVRTEDKDWMNIDEYINEHTHAKISHGLCPECIKAFYPDISSEVLKED